MVNNIGNGAADPPGGGDDADKDEGNEDIFHGFHTGEGQNCHLPDPVLFKQTVPKKQKKAKYQGDQNGNIVPDADNQGHCKQGKNADFDHISDSSQNIAFHYTINHPRL